MEMTFGDIIKMFVMNVLKKCDRINLEPLIAIILFNLPILINLDKLVMTTIIDKVIKIKEIESDSKKRYFIPKFSKKIPLYG
jgi:hypothetical protein